MGLFDFLTGHDQLTQPAPQTVSTAGLPQDVAGGAPTMQMQGLPQTEHVPGLLEKLRTPDGSGMSMMDKMDVRPKTFGDAKMMLEEV